MDYLTTTPPTIEPVTLAEAKLHLKIESSVTADDSLISTLITAAREWCEGYQNRAYIEQSITLKLDEFQDIIYLPRSPLISITSIKYLDSNGSEQTLSTSVYEYFTNCEPGEIRLKYAQTWPMTYGVRHAVRIIYKAGYQITTGATSTNITAISKANPCVITAAGHALVTGGYIWLSDIVDNGPDGDIEGALNDKAFVVTYLNATTFSVPVNSTSLTNSWASGGTVKSASALVPSSAKAAIKLLVGHLYEHREAVMDLNLTEVPMAVKSLLSMDRMFC
jgi:uncharacterized phiE125 gp8 family phage protein